MSKAEHQKTYIIQCQKTGRVKIGKSKNPKKRLEKIKVGSPTELKLVKVYDTDKESNLQREFHHANIHGEWHELTEDLKKFLERECDTEKLKLFTEKEMMEMKLDEKRQEIAEAETKYHRFYPWDSCVENNMARLEKIYRKMYKILKVNDSMVKQTLPNKHRLGQWNRKASGKFMKDLDELLGCYAKYEVGVQDLQAELQGL